MKEKFNPNNWLSSSTKGGAVQSSIERTNAGDRKDWGDRESTVHGETDTEQVISRIEQAHVDITAAYADWVNVGFSLASEFGEAGREYYHRLSRFYPGYSMTDCDKQYDRCIQAKGHGITIKTLFHLAKQAGIDVCTSVEPPLLPVVEQTQKTITEKSEPDDEAAEVNLPTLPKTIYDELPDFLQKVVSVADTNEERDILLLGSLVSLSACLNKVYGIYDGKQIYSNLYLFITAQASAGKGRLVHCKQLVKPIHLELRHQANLMKQQYENEMREFNSFKGKNNKQEKPVKPPEKMLLIPANNSTTGVFQLLSDNDGKGLIFETEGDTLAQAFKSDYGNYSDGFRKAFHHETISYYRRTDREYVEIDYPCLSTVLSGTPKQVASLIPNAENGLFSRFIFYHMNMKPIWKNVFASKNNQGLDEYFNQLGKEFLPLYKALNANQAIVFSLTEEQQDQFHIYFSQVQVKYLTLQGMDYMATIRRLGLIAFRIAMVLSAVRILETGDFSSKQQCRDDDFRTVLAMVNVLVKHASHVFSELPEDIKPAKLKNRKEQFLDQLPLKFTRQNYLDLAKKLTIPEKTADRYVAHFCEKNLVFRDQPNSYTNLSLPGK